MNTLVFRDSAGNTLTLDTERHTEIGGAVVTLDDISVGAYSPRIGVTARYGRSGGVSTGDRKLNTRDVRLTLDVTCQDDQSYINFYSAFLGFFESRNDPVYLEDTENDRRIRVILNEESESHGVGIARRVSRSEITFTALSSMWEDLTETVVFTGTGTVDNGESISITNPTKYEIFPRFVITAVSDNQLFKLTNQTSSVFFELGSNLFLADKDLIIDTTERGKITIDDVDVSNSMSTGSGLISLVPGINVISYESSLSSISVEARYRKEYPR